MKNIVLKNIIMILIGFLIGILSISTLSYNINAASEKETIVINGNTIKYRNGETIMINKEHDPTGGEFRGVWVSALTSDITG